MTSKERILKVLNHQEPDRIPVGEMGIDYPITEKVLGRPTYYRAKLREQKALWEGKRDEVVNSQKRDIVDLVKTLNWDFVPVFLTYSSQKEYFPPEFIAQNTWRDLKGNIWKYSTTTEDTLCIHYRELGEEIIEELNAPWRPHESELEVIRYVVRELGQTHFIIGRGPTEGTFPNPDLLNIDLCEFLIKIIDDPDFIYRLLEAASRRAIQTCKVLADEGVDAIQLGVDYCFNGGPFISPLTFEEIILPFFQEHCKVIHEAGLYVIKHTDGNTWGILDMLIDAGIDALHGIQPSAGMDLKELKAKYGRKITFFGAVDCDLLVRGTPNEVKEAVRYCIKHAATGGGLVLSSSNSIQLGVKYDNYMTMLDTIRQEGYYPIKLSGSYNL